APGHRLPAERLLGARLRVGASGGRAAARTRPGGPPRSLRGGDPAARPRHRGGSGDGGAHGDRPRLRAHEAALPGPPRLPARGAAPALPAARRRGGGGALRGGPGPPPRRLLLRAAKEEGPVRTRGLLLASIACRWLSAGALAEGGRRPQPTSFL